MSVLSLYIESTDSMILFLLMPVSYLKMTTITHDSSSDHQDERIELWSFYDNTCTKNTFYADEVPGEIRAYKILIILGCIFLTPITFLCCIPIICSLKKVRIICTPKNY